VPPKAVASARGDGVMVTTKSLRDFAVECLSDAWNADDPSQRQTMIDIARSWAKTADVIDRRVDAGQAEKLPDLKHKLN
jgi:hypothetical protein